MEIKFVEGYAVERVQGERNLIENYTRNRIGHRLPAGQRDEERDVS